MDRDQLFLSPPAPFPTSRSRFNDELNFFSQTRGRPGGLRNNDDFNDAYNLDTFYGQWLVSRDMQNRFRNEGIDLTPIRGFNPFSWQDADLDEGNYPLHIWDGARSPGEIAFRKRMYDSNMERRRDLEDSAYWLPRLAGTLADPINIIPIPFVKAATTIKGGIAAASLGGIATFAPFELARANIDPTSTAEESLFAIGGSTILAGMLGGGIGGLTGRQINRVASSYFAGHSVVDAANELNKLHPNAIEGILPREKGAALRDWVQMREGEIPSEYDARLLEIENDPVMFERYAAISDSYKDGSGLVETGLKLEKFRSVQHPWMLLKNTKFGGILGNRIRRLADEVAGSPGMFNKGNEELQPSAQSAHTAALLHNVALVNFNRGMIDGFLKSEGINPQNANKSDVGRALGALHRSLPGVKAGLRQKEFDEDVFNFYVDPRDTSIANSAGKKDAYVDSVKESASSIKDYMEYMAQQGMATGVFGPRAVKRRIEKIQESLKAAREDYEAVKETMSPERRKAYDTIHDLQKRLEDEQDYLKLLNKANEEGKIPRTKSEIGLGHWPMIWKQQEVEARRSELIERLQAFYREDNVRGTVGERAEETIGRILGMGEFARLSPILRKILDDAGMEPVSVQKWMDDFESLIKETKVRAPRKADLQQEVLTAVQPFLTRLMTSVRGVGDDAGRFAGPLDTVTLKSIQDESPDLFNWFKKLQADTNKINKVLDDIENLIAESNSGNFGVSVNALSRKINIPPHLVKDFIETDPHKVMRLYHRRMAVSVEMARRFDSDPTMSGELAAVARLMDDQIAAATGKQKEALTKEKELNIQAIADLRDKVLGVYRIPRDPSALNYRATQFTKHWMALSLMGQPIIASLADLGKIQMALGWKQMFGMAWAKHTIGKEAFRLAGEEARLAGLGSDIATRMRFENLMDFDEFYTPMNKMEEFTARNVDRLFFVNLLTPYTDYLKVFTGSIMQSNMIKVSEKLVKEGKDSLSRTEKMWVARSGLGEDELRGIYSQWQKAGGQKQDDVLYLANTNEWTDLSLQRRFRVALATEVENAVITPGPNTRLNFMSTNIGGLMTQFKNFALTATHQITMAGLQQRDAYTLQALTSMIAIGAFVDLWKSPDYDKRSLLSTDRLVQAIDYSGVTGILFDLNNMVEVVSGHSVGARPLMGIDPIWKNPTVAQRGGQVFGPAGSLGFDFIWSLTSPEAEASDVARSIRRLTPYNNLIWWDKIVDQAQREVGQAFTGDTES